MHPGDGEEGEEGGVPPPDEEELDGHDGRGDAGVEVLLPDEQAVRQQHQFAPIGQARLDGAGFQHGDGLIVCEGAKKIFGARTQ